MVHTNLQHRRTHNLLLISKLLSQQTQTSPFTVVLDTLEQPAKPLLSEYIRRAKLSKSVNTALLAFETFEKPPGVDSFVPCHDIGEGTGWRRIAKDVANLSSAGSGKRLLVIIDSLTTLASLSIRPASALNLTAFLSSLLQPTMQKENNDEQGLPAQISIVAVYHTDVPLPSPPSTPMASSNIYSPLPLSLLSFLATTIITLHPLATLLAERAAQAKSLAAPSFGLTGEIEGVLVGLKPRSFTNLKATEQGIVLEVEHRRKSGRGVREWFFLPHAAAAAKAGGGQASRETVTLLDDHPLFRKPTEDGGNTEDELSGMTFELGLTERQRLEREGVVLPYFDAQKAGGGGGEGGRILYDMGIEDDFDEEEDEI